MDTEFLARAEDQTFRMVSCKSIWNGHRFERECTRELSAKAEEIEALTYKNSDLQYELTGEPTCNMELQEKLTKAVKENEKCTRELNEKTKELKAVELQSYKED